MKEFFESLIVGLIAAALVAVLVFGIVFGIWCITLVSALEGLKAGVVFLLAVSSITAGTIGLASIGKLVLDEFRY